MFPHVDQLSTAAMENILFLSQKLPFNGKSAGTAYTQVLHTNQVMGKELLIATFYWSCRKFEIFPLHQWKRL